MNEPNGRSRYDIEAELNARLSWSFSLLVVVCLIAAALFLGWTTTHEGTLIGATTAVSMVLFFAGPDFMRGLRGIRKKQ
jgi:lipopolysaccharide export LptBFGC system permease protein LptF